MQKGWQPWTQQRFSQRKQQLSRHVRSSRYGSCLQHTCFEAEQQIAVRLTKAQQQGSELRSLGSEEAENAIKALPNNHTENCACMTSCHVSSGCVDGTASWWMDARLSVHLLHPACRPTAQTLAYTAASHAMLDGFKPGACVCMADAA